MSSKFFDKISKLPIVKVMQVSAVILFVFGMMGVLLILPFQFSKASNVQEILIVLTVFINGMIQALFAPMILLSLAEIIKQKE